MPAPAPSSLINSSRLIREESSNNSCSRKRAVADVESTSSEEPHIHKDLRQCCKRRLATFVCAWAFATCCALPHSPPYGRVDSKSTFKFEYILPPLVVDYLIYELTPAGTCTNASLERIIALPTDHALIMIGDAVPFDLLNPSWSQPSLVVYTQRYLTPPLIYSHPLIDDRVVHWTLWWQ